MTIKEAENLYGPWEIDGITDDIHIADVANQLAPTENASSVGALSELASNIKENLSRRKQLALAVGALSIVASAGVATGRRVFSS